MALLAEKGKGDNQWVQQFLPNLSTYALQLFTNVQDWTTKSEETDEILEMICTFIKFITKLITVSPQCMDAETYEKLKKFIELSLYNKFDLPKLSMRIIEFLTVLIDIDLPTVANISPLTMSFFYSSRFNPLVNEWFDVCKRVMTLHLKLLKINKENAETLIINSLKRYDANDSLIKFYLQNIENEQQRPRDRLANNRDFYFQFVKYKASLGK